jgi:hypothetical protein
MTDFTTTTPIKSATDAAHISVDPRDILMSLIVALLAPMFLAVSGGNINYARMAAIETVNGYSIRNSAGLLSVAQIIAFGFAALGSLSLAMADNLSLSMTLRLRANANACHRSAEQSRRALSENPPDTTIAATTRTAPPGEPPAEPEDDLDEAAVIASVAAAQKRAAETQTRIQTEAPSAARSSTPAQSAAATETADQQRQAMWASAAAFVAAEFTAELPNLPPAERKVATMRAAALSSCANHLLSGAVEPRLRPGDLNAMIRPKTA